MIRKLISKQQLSGDQGNISLEQILFIGAIVAMGTGVLAFYTNIGDYFQNIELGNSPNFASNNGSNQGGK